MDNVFDFKTARIQHRDVEERYSLDPNDPVPFHMQFPRPYDIFVIFTKTGYYACVFDKETGDRLCGAHGLTQFDAIERLMRRVAKGKAATRAEVNGEDMIGALVEGYLQSLQFASLSRMTLQRDVEVLEALREDFGHYTIAELAKAHEGDETREWADAFCSADTPVFGTDSFYSEDEEWREPIDELLSWAREKGRLGSKPKAKAKK